MSFVSNLQQLVVLVLGIAAFALEVFALVEAIRYKPEAYSAAGKRSKNFWLALTAVAAAIGFVTVFNPLALVFLTLIAVGVAGVFLADVRPALRQVTGRGGSSNNGPYGPW